VGRFVSPSWRVALWGARFVVVRRAIEAVYDLVGGPGPRASAIARTKLIDDLIREASPVIDQLVILGAGYDTRAHRLGCLSDRAVYEIDHPSTQGYKRAVLARAELSAATAPRYVASTSSATTSPPL
jgi:methyltransferase (TIGR00027 family)